MVRGGASGGIRRRYTGIPRGDATAFYNDSVVVGAYRGGNGLKYATPLPYGAQAGRGRGNIYFFRPSRFGIRRQFPTRQAGSRPRANVSVDRRFAPVFIPGNGRSFPRAGQLASQSFGRPAAKGLWRGRQQGPATASASFGRFREGPKRGRGGQTAARGRSRFVGRSSARRGRGGRRRGGRGNPVAEADLDAALDAYMGTDVAKSRLDNQLDAYFGRAGVQATLDKPDPLTDPTDINMNGGSLGVTGDVSHVS